MSTAHTPGPWYTKPVGGNHGQHLVIAENSGATVAVIYNDNDDARLISAAPDMYDALGEAWAVLDSYVNGQGAVSMQEIEAAHLAVHNAMEKARTA